MIVVQFSRCTEGSQTDELELDLLMQSQC